MLGLYLGPCSLCRWMRPPRPHRGSACLVINTGNVHLSTRQILNTSPICPSWWVLEKLFNSAGFVPAEHKPEKDKAGSTWMKRWSYTHPAISGSELEPFLLFPRYLFLFKRKLILFIMNSFGILLALKFLMDIPRKKFPSDFGLCNPVTPISQQRTHLFLLVALFIQEGCSQRLPQRPLHGQAEPTAVAHSRRCCKKLPWGPQCPSNAQSNRTCY